MHCRAVNLEMGLKVIPVYYYHGLDICAKKKEKEFDGISCIIHDIQICLNCGSESITVIGNEIQCTSCGNIKSKCGVRYLV